jgi:geranylgeranyl reductase family protein
MPDDREAPIRDTPIRDTVVVGAGPAGIAAALMLRRGGRDVVVIDKATFPRDKCCGDGLTTGALRLLDELGFDPATVPNWTACTDVRLRSPRGRETRLDLPRPERGTFAAIAPRNELDHALVRLAVNSGIAVHEGHAFTGIDDHGDHVTVHADGLDPLRARFVVAADGMWSPVRKAVDPSRSGYLGEWHAFRQYASNVTGPAAERLYVWFEEDLLPGYAWSFPLAGNRANVGFGILRGGSRSVQEMKDLWPDLLARPHIVEALGHGFTMEDRHTAWPIPARVTSTTLASGRVLFVGDAACVTDTLTGEGIGQALLSGRLAARAIVECGARDASVARATYERAMKRHFFADHRMSVVLGAILRSPLGARAALRLAGTNEWTRRNFVRWMFEDEPRAAAFTPSRWHRGFLKRDGAFRTRLRGAVR